MKLTQLSRRPLALWTGLCMLLVSGAGGLAPQLSQAYEKPVHFYYTYIACVAAGIKPAIATQIALGAQAIDEFAITSAFTTTEKRALFHFPDITRWGVFETHGVFGKNLVSSAQPDSPVAHQLSMFGMKLGWYLTAAAGGHVIQDSWGHKFFTALFGHSYASHNPDRQWKDFGAFTEMSGEFMKLVVAIRKLLPESALDRGFRFEGDLGPAYADLSAEQLQKKLFENPDFLRVFSHDYLTDGRYTRVAVEAVLDRAFERKALKSREELKKMKFNLDEYLPTEEDYAQKKTARTLLKETIMRLHEAERAQFGRFDLETNEYLGLSKSIFNRHLVYGNSGLPVDEITPENFGLPKIISMIVDRLSYGLVPDEDVDKQARFTYEANSIVRDTELEIRHGDCIRLISKILHGGKYSVVFSSDKGLKFFFQRIKQEVKRHFGHEGYNLDPSMPANVYKVTLSEGQRWQLRAQMFTYQYIAWFFGKFLKREKSPIPVRTDVPDDDSMLYKFEGKLETMIADGRVKKYLMKESLVERFTREWNGFISKAEAAGSEEHVDLTLNSDLSRCISVFKGRG